MGKIGTQAPSVSREAAQLEAAIAAAGLSEEAAHKVLTCGLAAAYVPQRGQSMKPRKDSNRLHARSACSNLSSHRAMRIARPPDLGRRVTDEEAFESFNASGASATIRARSLLLD